VVDSSLAVDSSLNGQAWQAPDALAAAVRREIDRWQREGRVSRLWQRDASLWTNQDEANWLGWLDAIAQQQASLDRWRALADEVRRERFTHALLLGMGGSSLCLEVWATTFGRQRGWPELHVLDGTSPSQVIAVEHRVDLARTIIIVASKSGSTLEPNIFKQYCDVDVLAERGRRVLRVHLGVDVAAGLQDVCDLIEQAI
jgi:transaldolase/glucose-6-phosphate isomerase